VAQEELDQVAEAHKRAMKLALEAKLREARQHAKEQAEFFQKEIREALLFEQQEHSAHRSQLRRMRLAMMKWRFDYQEDAKTKSAEITARGVLAKLAAAGLSAADVQSYDPVTGGTKKVNEAQENAWQEKEARKQEVRAQKQASKRAEAKEKAAARPPSTQRASVEFADKLVETPTEVSSGESEAELPVPPPDWIPDQELTDCRLVMEKLWSRLPEDDDCREFFFNLEAAVPYEEEILLLYEEELQRHGIVCALDATDGRAEEALQAEREAAAVKQGQDTLNEDGAREREKQRKKGAKPAVPTVKRRVNIER